MELWCLVLSEDDFRVLWQFSVALWALSLYVSVSTAFLQFLAVMASALRPAGCLVFFEFAFALRRFLGSESQLFPSRHGISRNISFRRGIIYRLKVRKFKQTS